MVYPILLGSGKRLFNKLDDRMALHLAEAKPVGGGILTLIYHPQRIAGEGHSMGEKIAEMKTS
jgi:hypothetical protein